MSWIKWTHGLSRKPEVMQIAYRLGRSRHEVAGLLMEWWEWTDVNVNIDESASGFDPDACPGVVRVGADGLRMIDAITGVEGMAEALVSVGWASIENGNLVLPNFGRHNGKSAKARALDAARKRADRRNSVRKASGSKPDKIRNRGEEKRGDSKDPHTPLAGGDVSKPKTPPKETAESVPIPPELATDGFRAAWADWIAERRERRKALTPRAARMQLEKLRPGGADAAIASIRKSIESGWAGIFPNDSAKTQQQAATPIPLTPAEPLYPLGYDFGPTKRAQEILARKAKEREEAARLAAEAQQHEPQENTDAAGF